MSDLTNPTPTTATGTPEMTQLKNTCDALEAQTHTLRVVLVLVIGALCLFFWREANYNGALAAQMQPQVTKISQYVAQLQKQESSIEKQNQALQGAVERLGEYAQSHPDYASILAKYGLVVAPAASVPSAAKPATAPVKK